MTNPRGKVNKAPFQPYRVAGVVVFLIFALVLWLVFLQYKGDFTEKTKLTMLSDRAGLVMDPGSKVTFNGVQIGRVDKIDEVERDGKPAVKFSLDVYPKYLHLIPANVDAKIVATTVFGEKYVSMTPPENPLPQRVTPSTVIDARSVTTEINTLFQTITEIAEKVDPVKVNLTLSAAAQALSGLGDKFGQSIINGSAALDDINPRMPIIRHDIQQFSRVADTFSNAAPDLFDFLNNASTTAHTVHAQEKNLDQALLAAAGFGATGAEIFNKGGPYFARGAKDLVPTAQLLDTYSPEILCSIRNLHDSEPKVAAFTSPYSLRTETEIFSGLGLLLSLPGIGMTAATAGLLALGGLVGGAPNPYIYPENLPRLNAHGGPGGAPGCWQTITRELWPAPTLVMDTGSSIAPYNHIDTGSPYAVEYVWGRQMGDHTINP
ncbi:MCE family protein [Mycobacterium paraterrae]|uniref:MCE family protein n=1 Tax=Mycobacterium paraterrae TaxID=577492 RepID=A0ABY3VS69_9MYCO|nr:MCE family protein [Mycobacterium paraterrae]UMB70038.1 MCE family protein [Mycobacterium paraterrae]